MRKLSILTSVLLSCFIVNAETTVTNNTVGFSAYLPDKWVCTQTNDSTAVFNDTSLTYQSQITIKKYHRNKADYSTPEDWTRAHFIAYLLVTEYSYDPFGAVLYYDSTAMCKQGTYWATEAFSEFYTLDTALGSWDELIRFTAAGDYGFSIYAIGDTSDMKKNIGMYAAIIRSVQLIVEQATSVYKVTPVQRNTMHCSHTSLNCAVYDLSGKKRTSASISRLLTIDTRNGIAVTQIKLK